MTVESQAYDLEVLADRQRLLVDILALLPPGFGPNAAERPPGDLHYAADVAVREGLEYVPPLQEDDVAWPGEQRR